MTSERKYALLLRKREKLEEERRKRDDERAEMEKRKEEEHARLLMQQEKEWEVGIDALEVRKELLAEMIAIGDWSGLRRELSESLVGVALHWSGPILAGSALIALPLLREIVVNWATPVGYAAVSLAALYLVRLAWRHYHPSPEDIEEELYLLEAELGLSQLMDNDHTEQRPMPTPQYTRPVSAPQRPIKSPIIYSQPSITRPQPLVGGGYKKKSILDVVMASNKPHFLYVGATRSGKTTLVRHTIKARAARGDRIIICDPHNIKGSWGHYKVSGGGADWAGYQETLDYLNDYMKSILDQLHTGTIVEENVPLVTCYLGEWSWSAQEMDSDATDTLATLIMGGAKAGIRLIIDAQSDRVESLGIKGRGDLRDSLARVRLSLRGRNGEKYTAHYDGQKVASAGPFEGWAETFPTAETFPETFRASETPKTAPETFPETFSAHNDIEEPRKFPNSDGKFPNTSDFTGKFPDDLSSSEVLVETCKLLAMLEESPTLLGDLITAIKDGAKVKELMNMFNSNSGRLYKQRKQVIDFAKKLSGVDND